MISEKLKMKSEKAIEAVAAGGGLFEKVRQSRTFLDFSFLIFNF